MIRSRNSDNSGSARTQRLRWISAAGGPIPVIRPNIGSMALDAIFGKAECCASSSSSSIFVFDAFNALTGTDFSPIAVDLNEQRTTPSSLQTVTLVIVPITTIPASFDISSYTSYNTTTATFQYSWGTIKAEGVFGAAPYVYYATTSHEIVTASQFVPTEELNTYTFQFIITTITYNVAHIINQFISVPSLIITGTIPASFMAGSGIYDDVLNIIDYSWGTIDISGTTYAGETNLSLLSADTILSATNFVNTGGNNYTLNYSLTQDTVFYYFDGVYGVEDSTNNLEDLYKNIAAAFITGYPLLVGDISNQAYIVLGAEGRTACFLAGSPVTLADGSTKPIETIKAGDVVLGAFGEHNTVLALKQSVLGDGRMCKINDTHITTLNHPHITANKTFVSCNSAIDSTGARLTDLHSLIVNAASDELYYSIFELKKGRITPMEIGGTLLQSVDGPRPVHSIELLSLASHTPIYNLSVSGSHTYYVNGYAVTGDMKESDFDVDNWIPLL